MSMTYGPQAITSIGADEEHGLSTEEVRQLRALRVLGGQWSYPYAPAAISKVKAASGLGATNPAKSATSAAQSPVENTQSHGTASVSFNHGREAQIHSQHIAADALTTHQIQSELASNGATTVAQVRSAIYPAGEVATQAQGAAAAGATPSGSVSAAPGGTQQTAADALRYQQIQNELQTSGISGTNPLFFMAVNLTPITAYTPVNSADALHSGRVAKVSAIGGVENRTIEAKA
jgi:hypothetical protein